MRLTFIGGGNMAEAMVAGLLRAGVAPALLRVAEPHLARREALAERYGIEVFEDNAAAVTEAEVVVVAVKPPVVPAALRSAAPGLGGATLVLSIAAGVTMETLQGLLPPGQAVVRAMPNTPALVGAGITALYAPPGLAPESLAQAQRVMEAVGETLVVGDEGSLDAVTALSGSGPAYVFLIAEALSDGGVACGLPRALSDRLAIHTLLGSARLLAESGHHPGVLKYQVTSPGGTTIAGLQALERGAVRNDLMEAVQAAWRRARELRG